MVLIASLALIDTPTEQYGITISGVLVVGSPAAWFMFTPNFGSYRGTLMDTYTYYLTLEVQGMNEESAENKLEKFLGSLELKKNQHLSLTGLEVDDGSGSGGETEASDNPAPKKSKRPSIKLPKNAASEWDDELDDVEWDSLDEEEAEESPTKPQPVEGEEEEEDWDWDEDDWDEDDDSESDDDEEDDDDDISSMLEGLDD